MDIVSIILTITEGPRIYTLLSLQKKCSGHFSIILLKARKSNIEECTQTRANVAQKLFRKWSICCTMQSQSSYLRFELQRFAKKKNKLGVGTFLFSKMPASCMVLKSLSTILFILSLNKGLLVARNYLQEVWLSIILDPYDLAVISINGQYYHQSMETQHKNDPFSQYSLKRYHALLHSLPPIEQKQKVMALAEGCLLRHKLKLYKGEKNFTEDLQVVLDDDRHLAPHILKEINILVNKDGSTVLSQCTDCGRYMPPFKYCQRCNNAHFCSQACEVRSKLSHQAICKPRQLPSIDAAIQIQLHVGGDLGKEVQVYYQHQMRMSLKIRGEDFIRKLFDYFVAEGKGMLPTDCRPQIINGHLSMRRADSVHVPSNGNAFVPENIDLLCQAYSNNSVLCQVALQCLKRGGILTHLVKQIHNNHFHMIYIFLCS